MLKKITLGVLAIVLLAAVEMSVSQPADSGAGQRPRGGMRGAGRAGAEGGTASNPILANSDAEKKILDVLEDMDRNQRAGMMNVPLQDGRLLRLLTQAASAKRVVEIGTSNGYSGIWFCLALRATGGKLITHDIDAGRVARARENFKQAGVDQLVTIVMGDAHEQVKKLEGPIDIVFIDADKPGYIDYLTKTLPLVRPGGLIIAHNVNMGGEMGDFVKAITTDPNLETVFMGQGQDLSITLKKQKVE